MKIKLTIFTCVICFITLFALIYYLADSYPEFYRIGTSAFQIPGLETDFIPQGIDYHENSDKFIISGYMNGGKASRFYIINNSTGKIEKYFTLKVNGKPYNGHAGGVAVNDNYAWVVGDKMVHRFNFVEALNADNASSVDVIDSFTTGNGADFVLVYNNKLIVGEYYKAYRFVTPSNHHIKTLSGETNRALAFVYSIDQTKDFGVVSNTPEAGISLTNQVQGMTFTKNGQIALSISYGITKSEIKIYDNVLNLPYQTTIKLNETELPIYVLDNNHLIKVIYTPQMIEEIVLVNDKVYSVFESASKKYRLFARQRIYHVYTLDI